MDSVPIPASFENAALRMPVIITDPRVPPAIACPVNASLIIRKKMQASFLNTNQIMRQVIYALVLGVGAQIYFFGFSVLIQILLGCITAVASEAIFLRLRGKTIKPSISDGSAVLTAILLAISIPSIAPWWVIVLGVLFAIIFGKQIFGGLGLSLIHI